MAEGVINNRIDSSDNQTASESVMWEGQRTTASEFGDKNNRFQFLCRSLLYWWWSYDVRVINKLDIKNYRPQPFKVTIK